MRSPFLRSLCAFFAAFFLLAPVIVSASEPDTTATVAGISAQSHFLMDADTGRTLSEGNADLALPMASTTKIMTCILALEQGVPSDEVVIPREAVGVEGSSVYLTEGERLTLEELLYALMLESANDAAVAIALAVSDTVEDFVGRMNEKAKEIGMTSTSFMNPHGLPADGHFSTARDMSLLMAYCMKNELFAQITSTKTKNISAPDGRTRYLSNHNRLLRSLEYCIGGKTGYTKTAGRCLVTAAQINGKTLICTTLGDPNDWKDHTSLYGYGFSLYEERSLAEIGSLSMNLPVVGGATESVAVSNTAALTLSLRSDETPEMHWELPHFVYAPTEKGDVLGEAVFTLNGKEIGRLPVAAKETAEKAYVEPGFWKSIWNTIKSWWQNIWNK